MSGRWAVWVAVLALTACGKPSAEDAARKIAEKECECRLLQHQERDSEITERAVWEKQLVAEIKSGAIQTKTRLMSRQMELQKAFNDKHTDHRNCSDALEKMRDQTDIDYPQEDNRKTIRNLTEALDDQCRKEQNEARRKAEEARGVQTDQYAGRFSEFQQLSEKLPYGR